MGDFTDLLYARPSFAEGVARIIDFGNTLSDYNVSPSSEEADFRALESDWRAVGADLKRAIRCHAKHRRARHVQESAKKNRQGFSHREADAKSLLDEAFRRGMGGAAACEWRSGER